MFFGITLKTITIIVLVIFNVFYMGVGFYRFLSTSEIEREVESDHILNLNNIRIVLCFVTSISGFIIFCAKHKIAKVIYLFFLIIGISLSCYKLINSNNYLNNTNHRDALLDIIKNNETETDWQGYQLMYYQKTYKCCGINGPHDYPFSDNLPQSCCNSILSFDAINPDEDEEAIRCRLEDAHKFGCWRFFFETNEKIESSTFNLNLIVLFAQCLAAILTLTLFRKEDIYY